MALSAYGPPSSRIPPARRADVFPAGVIFIPAGADGGVPQNKVATSHPGLCLDPTLPFEPSMLHKVCLLSHVVY